VKYVVLVVCLLALSFPAYSQVKKNEERQTITLCWYSPFDTAASYLIYYNRYNVDTAWKYIGTTKEKTFDVAKQGFKGDIAFGVRVIYYNDTSAIHTSLDPTACSTVNATCDTNCTSGAWYVSWHVAKLKKLAVK
jgi:hypothetical protein